VFVISVSSPMHSVDFLGNFASPSESALFHVAPSADLQEHYHQHLRCNEEEINCIELTSRGGLLPSTTSMTKMISFITTDNLM
jgi:hypothetical protein